MKPPVLIASPEGVDYLKELRRAGDLVALVGSGISIWHPSNMPNGQRITDALANVIADRTVSPRSTVLDRIRGSAFEHIMERYPKPDLLRPTVAGAFYPTPSNPVHEALAHLLNDGVIRHIITTNYDVGLEAACSAICDPARAPQVVVTEGDLSAANPSQPILFKIHGCASPGKEGTIVLTLGGEGEMPEWKRELLARLVNGQNLLICGYSGLDFEICPELARLSPSSFTWNSFLDPRSDANALTPNAKRVLDATDGLPLVGDMNLMLKALTLLDWDARFSAVSPDFVSQLVGALDSWELDKWRVWVLNGLGCALDGVRVGRRMYNNSGGSEERKLDSLLALSEALFHSGRYVQAGRTYREAARLASSGTDWGKMVRAEVGVVESDRVAGYWLRARRRIDVLIKTLPRRVPPARRDEIINEIKLKGILLLRYPLRLYKMLGFGRRSEKIRSQAKQELREVAAYFSRAGSWFNFQHCEMLAARFGIPFSEIYTGPLPPLPSTEGYKHLGYIIAEMMAYRAALRGVAAPALRLEYVRIAQELGIDPEVWKLIRAIKRRFGYAVVPEEFHRSAREAWRRCEYTTTMRLLLRLVGEET